MDGLSTRQAARKLGLTQATLSRYIAAKKVPAPQTVKLGNFHVHVWSEEEIEHVRQLLPKIKNGRKTRYQKKQAAEEKPGNKKSAQPRAAVPHKSRSKNK